jgi:predicted TPR repeat methyltransferase
MHRPTWNPGILVSPVEDGYIAYDAAADRLHHLAPIAALLSELCDGTRTLEQLQEIVAPLLPSQDSSEIDRWVQDAAQSGFLSLDGRASGGMKVMGAEDLASLATHLRNQGKIRAAFLCQQRAAECSPSEAEHWCSLGDLAHILGRRDDARMAYGKYLELEPDDAEVRHIMVALQDGPPPSRVPDECIQQLYSRFSKFYEKNVCEELEYHGPEQLQGMMESALGGRDGLEVLDLGCGSGLAGLRFKSRASRMIGIDLSPEMIELARARNLYDHLDVAEITEWLSRARQSFDLILACDCFIYFGDLNQVVTPVARVLRPGGVFAFTVEKGEREPFTLTDSGRYQHGSAHVRDAAAAAGLRIERLEENFLRMEYGEEVTGIFVVLRQPEA